ncbi:MAG: hypothetical protein HC836_14625 [Richelia sp. RM2_1_2]|nr:hypothetical protein [Richelia sp. SM2_1_7]NJM18832.1 hypothetical protein [Richelia sp. SM1_7_0]NJN07719.1 hypothetical protein [Richelia sp. RM1_1_1]NJO27330.1 hypothetical protein [Richelia sp. SL_2_1]NJO59485.1 hypothetical protein [Richelia sp. RM2_1_2]
MIKKISTLGLLAAAFLIVPNAAFAEQGTTQKANQEATVIGSGSRVIQNGRQVSIQRQEKLGPGNRRCNAGSQSQQSNQRIDQNAVAIDGGVVNQNADQVNIQRQLILGSRYCY